MPFGLFNLKRKFLATVDPTSIITNDNVDDLCSPRKKVRIEDPASLREAIAHNSQDACAAGHTELKILPSKTEEEEGAEEVETKLKQSEQTCSRLKREAEHARAQAKTLREHDLACIVCHGVIQKPQTLKCGHTACYACLRKWWIKPPTVEDGAPMIDTEAESDLEEETPATHALGHAESNPEHRPRRRHRFSSAVKREKRCPHCNEVVKRRPISNFRLRDVLETMNRSLLPHTQARRDVRRNDIWHYIFHPPYETYLEPVPAHVRAAEEIMAAQERERNQAFAEGRAAGAVEVRMERARLNQARTVVMAPPLLQLDF